MIHIFTKKMPKSCTGLMNLLIYSFECNDYIFELMTPKLIEYTPSNDSRSTDTFFKDDEVDNKDNLSKFDKKYKTNDYPVDIKKVKSKSVKKKRNGPINIANKNIFIDSQDDLNVSTIKSRKITNKKKNKLKENNINSNASMCDTIIKHENIDKQIREIIINNPLTVQELSFKLNLPEAEIITYLFLHKNIAATINQLLDIDIAHEVASHYNFIIIDSKQDDKINVVTPRSINSSIGSSRPPIITILGHVDHGKTTLLDAILQTNLVSRECGGITQSISAYEMSWKYEQHYYDLVFLDTPGHQSFRTMRLRGAKVTDIALLVIAIDDGVKDQTIESLNYIKELNISFIVVITKVDKVDQNIDFILNTLSSYNVITQAWGGDIPVIQVSSLNHRNIDNLLSKICMLSKIKNFTANSNQLAKGTIVDSFLDKKQGPIANIIIQDGSLRIGHIIASGNMYGKVKKIVNLSSKSISIAFPSSIVQVLAFSSVPQAGLEFEVFDNDKQAKYFCSNYFDQSHNSNILKTLNNRVVSNSNLKQLNIILKSDTLGSLEAIIDLLSTLPKLKVQLNIIAVSYNSISTSDVDLAVTTNSIIVAFNVSLTSDMMNSIKKYNLVFQNFNIIYDLFDYVKSSMLDLIEPEYDKVFIGRAIVRTVFNINKGSVAGCYVSEGKLVKSCHIDVYRKDQLVYEGLLISLKRLKNDVNEVLLDNECGVMCDYSLWQENDYISAYNLSPKQKSL